MFGLGGSLQLIMHLAVIAWHALLGRHTHTCALLCRELFPVLYTWHVHGIGARARSVAITLLIWSVTVYMAGTTVFTAATDEYASARLVARYWDQAYVSIAVWSAQYADVFVWNR
jgi:hypothetical protein